MRRLVLALALAALPGLANADPMTAEAFDAATLGKTMTWSKSGQVYGVEEYLPNRRVRWVFTADVCREGTWYQDGDAICFQYEDRATPACWRITQDGDKLLAQNTNRSPGSPSVVVEATPEPLSCLGPEVGV